MRGSAMFVRRQAKQFRFGPLGLYCLCFLLLFGGPVFAAEPVPPEQVIREQIRALSDDDAEAAYTYASDGIKDIFASPEEFIEMVRNQYSALISPRSLSFSAPQSLTNDVVIQEVMVLDSRGESWQAVYRMGLADGGWRIEGVSLVNTSQQAV